MKNVKVPSTLRFSPLESDILTLIAQHEEIYVWQIALMMFGKRKDKPKSTSNAVTSAIRQINRKFEKHDMLTRIVGEAKGRGGKLVSLK